MKLRRVKTFLEFITLAAFGAAFFAVRVRASDKAELNRTARGAYYEFLEGTRPALYLREDIDKNGVFVEKSELRYEHQYWTDIAVGKQYIMLDATGDGVDECFIFGVKEKTILSYKNDTLLMLYSENGQTDKYIAPLNDGNFFEIHDVHPEYILWYYFKMGDDGQYHHLHSFSEPTGRGEIESYKPESDSYIIDGEIVTQEYYEAFTKPIFDIGIYERSHSQSISFRYETDGFYINEIENYTYKNPATGAAPAAPLAEPIFAAALALFVVMRKFFKG